MTPSNAPLYALGGAGGRSGGLPKFKEKKAIRNATNAGIVSLVSGVWALARLGRLPVSPVSVARPAMDVASESLKLRQAAIVAMRQRASGCVGAWVSSEQAIQLCLVCSLKDSGIVLEMLFSREVRVDAAKHAKTLAITIGEWNSLFGATAHATCAAAQLAAESCKPIFPQAEKVGRALRCTIEEPSIAAVWSRPVTRAACVLAMHAENHEEFLTSSLGSLVRSDERRLEDLRATLEEDGLDVLTLSELVVALGEAAGL